MLRNIAVTAVLVLGALAAYVATRSAEFRISRTRTIAAPPEVVHAYVNDFHNWPEWSPWEKRDPAMTRELSGAPAGVGAVYWWSGREVGEGRMTITDSRAPGNVTIRLEFIKPWTATNTARFDLEPSGSGTRVTWTMSGHNGFMAKAFSIFVNVEKMVGADFEKGLVNLDAATAATATRQGGARS